MIRAVVWKELREQGLIAVMLAVLGAALLGAAAAFADPPTKSAATTDIIGSLGVGRLLALMLVVTAGMVCGGALFAAEKEAGTMGFLDTLPTPRVALWWAKIVAGLVLAAAVVGALLGAAAALGLGDWPFLRRLVIYALLAFGWGALGSTLTRTTLGSVGVAIVSAAVASFAFLLPISLFLSYRGGLPTTRGWVVFDVLMLATPLALSAWRFTAPDRARAADDSAAAPDGAGATAERPPGLGIRALVWLNLRQLRIAGPVLSAFALAFGLALLVPELHPLFVWPPLALTAGVLTGVIAFGDEQAHRTAGFWGEHRLPIGRAWWVKIGIHLGLLAWLLVLFGLPGAVRAQVDADVRAGYGYTILSAVFRSRLLVELGPQGWKYALVPAVYGFVFGHVCGLLFRKPVVACGVAVMLGGVASAGWGPSLLAGGVKHWQVWGPAAAILLTGRFLIRAWSADRAGDRGPVLRLVGGMAFALAVFAGGLGLRVLEVRDDPTGGDDAEFVASLPGYDANLAGRDFHTAAERFGRAAGMFPFQASVSSDPFRRPRLEERLEGVIRNGWSDDSDLAMWLDRVYGDPFPTPGSPTWSELAAEAATKSVGVYELPALVTTAAATLAALDNAKRMAVTILVQALRRHAAGDPTAFVSAFRTVVLLTRNMRNGGGYLALAVSIDVERTALVAADGWLERLTAVVPAVSRIGVSLLQSLYGGACPLPPAAGAATERLVRAIVVKLAVELARTVSDADISTPFDARPHLLVDRFVIRGIMQAPNQWLTSLLDARGRDPDRAAVEADLIALAWAVPWEKERTRRLVGRAPEIGPRPGLGSMLVGRPGSVLLARGPTALDADELDTNLRVFRRVTILKAALLAYQIERSRPPAAQEDLVAHGYLARLPEDPHITGRPFGYRVSDGQPLVGRARAVGILGPGLAVPGVAGPGAGGVPPPTEPFVVPVPVGQVIVWSVGPDRIDQGGKVPPGGPRAEDLVYLIPPPPEPR